MEYNIIEFINDYNDGMNNYDLSIKYRTSVRTIERRLTELRRKEKINYRTSVSKNFKIEDNQDYNKFIEKYRSESVLNWKNIKSNRNNSKSEITKYLITSDYHVPYVNKLAFNSVLKLMDDIKFDGFIIDGDFMDFNCISHWNKGKHKTLEGKRLLADYIEGNIILDEIDKRLPKNADKKFLYGNHERFYEDFIEDNPQLDGLFDPKKELRLIERGYKVFSKQNHIEKLGKLHITHGLYTGENIVKKHIDSCKTNMLFGHLHTLEFKLESSPAKDIAIAGYCIGALCDMNPDYMQNKPDKWSHGFAIVYLNKKEDWFDVDLKRIINGKFVYNGKLYQG